MEILFIALGAPLVSILPTIRGRLCPTNNPDQLLERAEQRKMIIEMLDSRLHRMK